MNDEFRFDNEFRFRASCVVKKFNFVIRIKKMLSELNSAAGNSLFLVPQSPIVPSPVTRHEAKVIEEAVISKFDVRKNANAITPLNVGAIAAIMKTIISCVGHCEVRSLSIIGNGSRFRSIDRRECCPPRPPLPPPPHLPHHLPSHHHRQNAVLSSASIVYAFASPP